MIRFAAGTLRTAAIVFVRVALGAAFLSAVADRFGIRGEVGDPNVAWGSWDRFEAYTATLVWYLPAMLVPVAAWTATLAEALLGAALLIGVKLREVALASGVLLTIFALSMAAAMGVKAPLDFSVFTAAAAAFYLATESRSG